jgi:hypothetical protein
MQSWKTLVLAVAAGITSVTATVGTTAEGQARSARRSYEDPAFARGYAAGRERGAADARSRERYDPVASREYREGDRGYAASYGSRDAYKSNYREGFRKGYEDGYRSR